METKLFVGNLSPLTTSEDLRQLFAKAGMVLSVEVIKDRNTGKSKGYAFVKMVSQGAAGKAVSEYNGYNLDRSRIKVEVAREIERRAGNSRPVKFVEYKSYNESIAPNYSTERYPANRFSKSVRGR